VPRHGKRRWRIRFFDDDRAERLVELTLATLSALVGVTCASTGAFYDSSPQVLPASALSASAMPASDAAPQAAASAVAEGQATLGLPRFFGALGELASAEAERKRPVRVLWLGDSHTAADFLPDGLRSALQLRFGNGGPGYLLLGAEPYRHAGVKVEVKGTWQREPRSPAAQWPQDDGVFGLAGMRTVPRKGASATLVLAPQAVRGDAHWHILYRAAEGAALSARLDDQAPVVLSSRTASAAPTPSSLRRVSLSGPASKRLTMSAAAGRPEVFGVIVESSEPGVVLDTLGINGARVTTPLAWNEASFVAEAAAREPALVVIAYGTNEVFDARAPEAYAQALEQLVARLRRARREADCLVLGPPDVAERDGSSIPRVVDIERAYRGAAERAGCAFASVRQMMGGEGSFAQWARQSPPLASPDRVHLTVQGYKRLGQLVADAVLSAYDAFQQRAPRSR
jgi:lysophospholipase L1-like esterase